MTNANLTNVLVTDEQLAAVITEQLPSLLEARPAVRRNLRRTLIQFLDEEGLLERFERKIEELRAEALRNAGFEVVEPED